MTDERPAAGDSPLFQERKAFFKNSRDQLSVSVDKHFRLFLRVLSTQLRTAMGRVIERAVLEWIDDGEYEFTLEAMDALRTSHVGDFDKDVTDRTFKPRRPSKTKADREKHLKRLREGIDQQKKRIETLHRQFFGEK